MALTKQMFPISLAGTLDTKTDDKQVQPGNFTVLENAVFTRPGALTKRNGLGLLSQTVDYSDAQINQGQATSVFQDQLVLFTGEEAYSRLSHNTKWTYKGAVSSVINDTYQIIRNGFSQNNPDANKIDNVECYVWEDSRGGIRYSIVDSNTGNFILSDQPLNFTGSKPKVFTLAANAALGIAAQFVILFVSENNLYCSRIFINALSSTPTLETVAADLWFANSSMPGLYADQVFDACHCFSQQLIAGNITATTNHLLIAYGASDDLGPKLQPNIIQLNVNNIALINTENLYNSVAPSKISITPFPDMSTNVTAQNGATGMVLWEQNGSLYVGKMLTSTPMFIVEMLTLPEVFDILNLSNLAIIWNSQPFNSQIGFKLFFEFSTADKNPTLQYCISADLQVLIFESDMSVANIENLVVKKGIGLYSKPFIHNHKPYIMTIHESTYQSTYFITSEALEVISKVNQTVSGGLRKPQLTEVIMDGYSFGYDVNNIYGAPFNNLFTVKTPVSNGKFSIPTLKKGKLESEDNTIFTLLGVNKSSLDMVSPNHFLSSTINDNLYVVGGVLQNYDGNKFTEAGFHFYPENLEASFTNFAIVITQLGTVGTAQITALFAIPATRIRPGDYFTVSSADNIAQYYFWFTIDGVGVDPQVSGMTPVRVNLQSYMSDVEVATLIQATFVAAPEFTVSRSTSILEIASIAPGVSYGVLPGTVGTGNVGAGTYSYIAIWKYIDNAGRIHRSTTSIPLQVIVPGGLHSVSITVPLLSPTAKQYVIFEVYRTQSLGDLYYRVTSIENPVFNVQNQDVRFTSLTFVDTLSDADIQGNELLYTTGGVLDNDSPPPCSLITVFKNRLFIAGLDDPNLIQYTKIIDPSDKQFIAGFSDYLTVETDTRGGNITALSGMDDNLVIFKETQIFYLSGDGPTNTGEGGFGDPQLISTDTGCDNPNSVVLTPTGLLFKSPKGIYQLSRDLSVTYIGAAVEQFNHLTISSSVLLNGKNQVRFLTEEGHALVYDYYVGKWTTFTNYEGVDCDIYNGKFTMLRANGQVFQENDSFQDQTAINTFQHIPLTLETANISTAGLIGFQRIYRVLFLGEYKGEHKAKIGLAYDFSPTTTHEIEFDATTVVGGNTYGSTSPYGADPVYGGYYRPYDFRAHCALQKCTSIRIRFEDIQTENYNEGLTISSIVLEVGVKNGPQKLSYTKTTGTT